MQSHPKRQIDGILLLNKAMDITSNRALQQVKHLFQAKKAGHTGSLDPIATGMLPICFGEATKFSQFLLDADKTYKVTASLGVKTTTADREGEVIAIAPIPKITPQYLESILKQFLGNIEQIPPMYSALKFQGQPLYKLARQGQEIKREPRRIVIHQLILEALSADEFTLYVTCSKGTYIRTLIEDIGECLGCGAHIKILDRINIKPFADSPMYSLDFLLSEMAKEGLSNLSRYLLPIDTALTHFPALKLSNEAIKSIYNGQFIQIDVMKNEQLVRLISPEEKFLGLGQVADGLLKPHRLVSLSR